ncbi:MAG: hypothetical protein NTX53_06910 [candidate division WOR-3 bacterium]|nr:hypothetical protein [candidate division WOR-3 bacterium]
MKTHRIIFGAILALISTAMLTARPRVRLMKPPPGRWGIEDLWKASVISDTACDAWFEGFVFEATRGQVFWTKTKPFPLSRGTRVYQYRDVTVEKTDVAQGYEAFVTRSGHLPAGNYRFKLLLMPFGIGDSFGFEVKPMGPPRLVFPKHGDTVRTQSPQFVWTPPSPAPKGRVTYELKLVEMMPGQTPEEAMRANRPWFESKGGVSTNFKYPSSAPKPAAGMGFAWHVTATTPDGIAAQSEVRYFEMTPAGGLPEIVVPLKVNVLKGIVSDEGFGKAAIEKRVVAAVEQANEDIFAQAGVKLDFSEHNINWDVDDPDKTNDSKMDSNYGDAETKAVNDKANEELKKKFGDGKKVRGFKLYITLELLNKGAGENGVGYWFPPDTPGFSVLEVDGLMVGIQPFGLLAHEILHGLGCLKDTKEKGNAMNPGKGRGTKLTEEQIKQLRAAAAKRQ